MKTIITCKLHEKESDMCFSVDIDRDVVWICFKMALLIGYMVKNQMYAFEYFS